MFQRAEAWELVPPGRNPCRSVRRYKQHSRERFLTPKEYRCLGRALSEVEANGLCVATGDCGHPAADAHGMPAFGDSHVALGRRGPHGR